MRLNGVCRRPIIGALISCLTVGKPLQRALAAQPPSFQLSLPESFVKRTSSSNPSILLVAGNFATGTTVSVERVSKQNLVRFGSDRADALAAYRDSKTAPGGTSSQVNRSSVEDIKDGSNFGFQFDMSLSLVGDEATASTREDPKLSRRTVVVALEQGDDLLVLWAGAIMERFDDADGDVLRQVARSFRIIPAS